MHKLSLRLALPLLMAVIGCSSSSTTPDAAAGGSDGAAPDGGTSAGPVAGPADDHCGTMKQEVDPAVCQAGPPDGGAAAGDGGAEEEEIRYTTEADDDDCKYHMSFMVTPVKRNTDVFFKVKATRKTDGSPATWAAKDEIEVFTADMSHPGMVNGGPVLGPAAGTIKFGPVTFDRPGRWAVRFHIQEMCTDNDEASPHSHVAFYIDVP